MPPTDQAHDYAQRLRELLAAARRDGLVFTVSGGRRQPYRLAVTVLPQTLDLNEAAPAAAQPEEH